MILGENIDGCRNFEMEGEEIILDNRALCKIIKIFKTNIHILT